MKIIEPSYEILHLNDPGKVLGLIEQAGRVCYKSENKIVPESAGPFVKRIRSWGHESVLEHSSMTVKFIIDRGVSHELVRHRLAAYSQESTRYANYSKGKFGGEITVIRPCFWEKGSAEYETWRQAMEQTEEGYLELLGLGAKPQEARSVLPNSLKTEVVMTANFREWAHVFKLRCSGAAHPQIRQVMAPLRKEMVGRLPEIFRD